MHIKLKSPNLAMAIATPSLLLGLILLGTIIILAIAAPHISPFPYDEINSASRFQPPGSVHWMGTDEFGRDVFSRVLMGSQISLVLGIGATAISLLIGVPLGLAAGYLGGKSDDLIMRGMDLLMSFPPVLLGLLILSMTTPELWKTIVAVGIVYVAPMARITRSATLTVSGEAFITAARARGERTGYILFNEVLLNVWPPILVEASLRMTLAVLLGAALSFLGLGAQPPSSDWGMMISEGRAYLETAPWVVVGPGLAMGLTVIAINLLADGLRIAFDPKSRSKQ